MYYALGQIALPQVILAAGNSDGEGTFWTNILVLAVLAVLLGIGSLIKTKRGRKKYKEEDYYHGEGDDSGYAQLHRLNKAVKGPKGNGLGIPIKTIKPKTTVEEPVFDFATCEIVSETKITSALGKERDLASGMELLEQGFLVKVVEKIQGSDKNDVMMRKLSFNELLRREQLKAAGSDALKVYARNEGNVYGKDVQCEAMKELAGRTVLRSGRFC